MLAKPMIREFLQDYLARRQLLNRYPDVGLGRRVSVHESQFETDNRIGDDSVVINSRFGKYTYIGPRCTVVNASIGRFTSIAPDTMVGTGGHPLRTSVALHPVFYLSRPALNWTFVQRDCFDEFAPTTIGSDVWLGAKVVVRDGVTIGNGVVVGAGAVVVRDLEPFGIYGGVPARLIRFRYPDAIIERLQSLAWWNQDDAWLSRRVDAFSDVERLLSMVDNQRQAFGHTDESDRS